MESAATGQQWASSPRHIWCPGVWASFWHPGSQQGFPLPSPDLPTLSVIPGTLWGHCLWRRKPGDKQTSVWILRFGAQSLACPPPAALRSDCKLQDEGLGGSELKLPVLWKPARCLIRPSGRERCPDSGKSKPSEGGGFLGAASPSSGRVPTRWDRSPLWPQTRPHRRGLPAGAEAGSRGPSPDTCRGRGWPAVLLRGERGLWEGCSHAPREASSLWREPS